MTAPRKKPRRCAPSVRYGPGRYAPVPNRGFDACRASLDLPDGAAHIVAWPADCMRHSYADDLMRDVALVASEMGHRATDIFPALPGLGGTRRRGEILRHHAGGFFNDSHNPLIINAGQNVSNPWVAGSSPARGASFTHGQWRWAVSAAPCGTVYQQYTRVS